MTGCALWPSFRSIASSTGPLLRIRAGWELLSGFAKINDLGVKVLEGGVAPDRDFHRGEPTNEGYSAATNADRSDYFALHHSRIPARYLLIGVAVRLLRHALTTAAADRPGRGCALDRRPEGQRQCHPGSFSNIGNSAGDHRSLALPQVSLLASTAWLGRYVIDPVE